MSAGDGLQKLAEYLQQVRPKAAYEDGIYICIAFCILFGCDNASFALCY